MTKRKTNQKQQQDNLPMLKIIALTITTAALAAFTTVHAQTGPAAAPPNDAQIAQIVLTADSVDVDYGKLAVKKTKNAEVKAFAETMIRDHTAVNDKAAALAKKINLTPEESDTSKSLKSDGDKEMAKLKAMHGAEFERLTSTMKSPITHQSLVLSIPSC